MTARSHALTAFGADPAPGLRDHGSINKFWGGTKGLFIGIRECGPHEEGISREFLREFGDEKSKKKKNVLNSGFHLKR